MNNHKIKLSAHFTHAQVKQVEHHAEIDHKSVSGYLRLRALKRKEPEVVYPEQAQYKAVIGGYSLINKNQSDIGHKIDEILKLLILLAKAGRFSTSDIKTLAKVQEDLTLIKQSSVKNTALINSFRTLLGRALNLKSSNLN